VPFIKTNNMKKLFPLFLILWSCLLMQQNLFGQSTQAGITGTVRDAHRQPIAGVTIRVLNHSTGFTTTTTTNQQGEYLLQQLPLGRPYTVGMSHLSYGERELHGYALHQGQLLRVDFNVDPSTVTLEAVQINPQALNQASRQRT
jgi:hypothetical protein